MSIKLINLNQYIRPKLVENKAKEWVLNGQNNSFYQYIIDRYNGSPTNSAIINAYTDLMIGNGLNYKNSQLKAWVKLMQVLSKRDLRRLISDFVLFGECVFHVVKSKDGKGLGAIYHLPVQNIAPSIADEKNEITKYWFCKDWKNTNKNPPMDFVSFGVDEKAKESIYKLKPYKAGKEYFADPDYLSGLPYCEMEEEIANYYISHIKNGLSFGYIVNIPAGSQMTEEQQNEIERRIIQKLTGSQNAGKMVLSFNDINGEKTTIEVVQLNDAHKQWEYLTAESRQQIMTAHRVTSPMLFGIKDNTGFGNNADELDTAEAQLYKRVIQPKQIQFLEALDEILKHYNINLDLYFRPLTEQSTSVQMSEQKKGNLDTEIADELISLGEDIGDDWELVDSRVYDSESIEFTSTGTAVPNAKSVVDGDKFKSRLRYTGLISNNSREFCRKMISANKLYRVEDIQRMSNSVVNEGWGPNGTDKYDILKFKGGGACRHYWTRETYRLKSDVNNPNNKQVTPAQARKQGEILPNLGSLYGKELYQKPNDMPYNGFLKPR